MELLINLLFLLFFIPMGVGLYICFAIAIISGIEEVKEEYDND